MFDKRVISCMVHINAYLNVLLCLYSVEQIQWLEEYIKNLIEVIYIGCFVAANNVFATYAFKLLHFLVLLLLMLVL